MKSNKVLLGLSVLSISATVAAAVLLKNNQKPINLPAKALEKSFTFDGSDFVYEQFLVVDIENPIDLAFVTGVSDDIDLAISFTEDGNEKPKLFGSNDHFLEVYDTLNPSVMDISIGVNNLKDLEIVFGVEDADIEVFYSIDFSDSEWDYVDYVEETVPISTTNAITKNWERTSGNPVRDVTIHFETYNQIKTFYIDHISLTWTC